MDSNDGSRGKATSALAGLVSELMRRERLVANLDQLDDATLREIIRQSVEYFEALVEPHALRAELLSRQQAELDRRREAEALQRRQEDDARIKAEALERRRESDVRRKAAEELERRRQEEHRRREEEELQRRQEEAISRKATEELERYEKEEASRRREEESRRRGRQRQETLTPVVPLISRAAPPAPPPAIPARTPELTIVPPPPPAEQIVATPRPPVERFTPRAVPPPAPPPLPPPSATLFELPTPPEEEEVRAKNIRVNRTPFEVPDDADIYLHAVCQLQEGDHVSATPYMLEEKGIDGQRFAFAWEIQRFRFFFSLLRGEQAAYGRGGALLLSRQDTIRLRGLHEGVLNDLRLHGMLLPFSFATVVHGWEDTVEKIRAILPRLEQDLARLAQTQAWTVTVSAIDARFADLQRNDTTEKRREADRHRSSYSSVPGGGKVDVKTLERVLNKQRRLAESIHAELQTLADRSTIRSMVSLQSGSSDDWKMIFRATYEFRPNIYPRFARLVTDLQYQHILQELMFVLSGDVEQCSLTPGNPG